MRLRRAAIPAAVAISAVLTLTVACGGGAQSEPGQISFATDKAAWEPQFEEVSDVADQQIDTGLDFTGYSDAETYSAFIRQSFRTRETPDMFTWHTGNELDDLVEQDLLEPTTEIWDKAVKNGDVPKDLRQYFTVGQEQYCVPMNAAYWVMYYNTDIFEKHDLKPPKNWDDLIAIADELKAADVTPFYQTNVLFSFVWFQTLLAGSDPDVYDALATGEAKYTDPAVVNAMEMWGDMIDKGYFMDAGVETDPQTLLKNGDVAMINFGTFLSGQLNSVDMKAGEDYDFFVVPNVEPSLDQTVLPFETGPMCTPSNAANKEKSMEFGEWWMGEQAQTAWANARGDVSFNPKAEVNDQDLAQLNETAGKDYRLVNRYFEATPTPILNTALDGFGDFVSNGGDPMRVLKPIQDEADKYWSSE